MSAEPGRKVAYSTDIRWRVVWQRAGMELQFRQIARNLTISLGTVYNIWKQFEETGDVASAKQQSRQELRVLDKTHEVLVVGLIMDDPTLYLREVCQKIHDITGTQVSAPTICRIIHKHGLTRKKVQQVALQRCTLYRGDFMAEVQLYEACQFVWVDESGCDRKDNIRKFGYAMRGETPVSHRLLHRGTRISQIVAMANDGVLAVELHTGSVSGEEFIDFVRSSLIPEMQPFDGQNPKSIAVMDNCSIHHVQPIIDMFNDAGILLLFLPPYSPDYNPIELLFSKIKYFLKEHDDVLQAMADPNPLIHSAYASITSQDWNNYVSRCGYC